jgi:hypothetical protein
VLNARRLLRNPSCHLGGDLRSRTDLSLARDCPALPLTCPPYAAICRVIETPRPSSSL